MRISDCSADVCSSDLVVASAGMVSDHKGGAYTQARYEIFAAGEAIGQSFDARLSSNDKGVPDSLRMRLYRPRSEEHTSELQSLMRNSSAVFCLKKKKKKY